MKIQLLPPETRFACFRTPASKNAYSTAALPTKSAGQ
ncbi:MAG: CRISPR-associated protein Cas5 [Prevotellaceae bacterium]|nr:CRISPR-associated protein Cas5 [Prevotellaceae bacterium]